MNLREEIHKIIENPVPPTKQLDMFDYGQGGNETVVLTPEAPQALRDLAGDGGEVILVSVNPYRVKLKNSDEVFIVYPKDIVIENNLLNNIKRYTKEYLDYLGVLAKEIK